MYAYLLFKAYIYNKIVFSNVHVRYLESVLQTIKMYKKIETRGNCAYIL